MGLNFTQLIGFFTWFKHLFVVRLNCDWQNYKSSVPNPRPKVTKNCSIRTFPYGLKICKFSFQPELDWWISRAGRWERSCLLDQHHFSHFAGQMCRERPVINLGWVFCRWLCPTSIISILFWKNYRGYITMLGRLLYASEF